MKKKSLLILSILLVSTIVPVALAGKSEKSGNSSIVHVYLYKKDPVNWDILDGPWGKLTYNMDKGKFVFNGHGLPEGIEYELISYAEPWPGEGSISIGSGVSDEYGNVHIMGKVDFEDLICNYYAPDAEGDYQDVCGIKIWLVLDSDFDGSKMVAWNPTEYIFEDELIICECTM
jgi:hypothetical protein